MDQAVIFDMDGVLIDSYQAHFESWRALAAEISLPFTEEDFAGTFGRTSREIILSLWAGACFSADDVRHLDDRKEDLFRRQIACRFPVMAGASDLLPALRAAGFRLAVGSSGPPANVDLVLDRLGGRELFDAVVSGDDVARGKPDPQVFLLAASRLGLAPSRCVVVEDAPAGVEAARRAGMVSVALLSTGRKRDDFGDAAPALIVGSLRDLNAEVLEALLNPRS
jgi:beta-phosphoglucomutase